MKTKAFRIEGLEEFLEVTTEYFQYKISTCGLETCKYIIVENSYSCRCELIKYVLAL